MCFQPLLHYDVYFTLLYKCVLNPFLQYLPLPLYVQYVYGLSKDRYFSRTGLAQITNLA